MTLRASHGFGRWVAALVATAMLLSMLSGCVTVAPTVLRLDGIVIDAQRRAADGEGGWVRVIRNGVTYDGHSGFELQVGDRVETTPRAEAVIRFPSGTEVLMRPSSGGRIGSFTDIVGEVFVKVKGIFSADTTFVKAGARGTQYVVRAMPGGTTYIGVFEGSVEVESTRNSWPSATLGPGDATLAYPRPPAPYRASAEELRQTQEWVERLERQVPVQTGVSATGVAVGIGIAALVGAIIVNNNSRSSSPERSPMSTAPSAPSAPPGTVGTVPRTSTPSTSPPPVIVPPSRTSPGTTRAPSAAPAATRTTPAATTRKPAARAVIRRPATAASAPVIR